MLYLISGAAASGKKTIAMAVAQRLPNLSVHHDNERWIDSVRADGPSLKKEDAWWT